MQASIIRRLLFIFFITWASPAFCETGYELWLRYEKINDQSLRQNYLKACSQVFISHSSPTITVIQNEIWIAFQSLLGKAPVITNTDKGSGLILIKQDNPLVKEIITLKEGENLGPEGFIMKSVTFKQVSRLMILAQTDQGLLYGLFQLLRMMNMQQSLSLKEPIVSIPRIKLRMLNHWDNLNRTVERGYAGNSIWNWHVLPGYIDKRYIDYARANASIGINAVVLTNVNANATVLTAIYLAKVKALADAFRPFGIKVFLTARFSAPVEFGGLKTADPLDANVRQWWKNKADEIYRLIPDFGGFLVKANSEGQPGPQTYGRNHAEGANMLAEAIGPERGVVIWRAFVYSSDIPEDRFKQSYSEFTLLDGQFSRNVLLQVKNGPIDFQPREPIHPLFGAMPKTPTMIEFQLTQEYLGFSTHLVFLAPLFKEVLNTDTYRPTKGSTVAKIVDGTAYGYAHTGMAGVSNIGSDINWTGHPFAQANWYALGRLAWNPDLTSEQIAEEWIRQTFTREKRSVDIIKDIMLRSRETIVNYMTPLGLNHIMGYGHHYGPAPWFDQASRADWNCTYFHRADKTGLGFDRTSTGSNALAQYEESIQETWSNLATTDDQWLAWFHHVPWNYTMSNGQSFWNSLALHYQAGVNGVRTMKSDWKKVESIIDSDRFRQVSMLLNVQEEEAIWWKDACLAYFSTFSGMPLPQSVEPPAHTLDYYKSLTFPYAPGNTH